MRADDKLGPRVPLVIGDVVMRLKPDPLLTFSQETVVARLPFTVLHHCTETERRSYKQQAERERKPEVKECGCKREPSQCS